MRIEALGDSAWLLKNLGAPAYQVAEALRRASLPGVLDVVASYEDVGVFMASGAPDPQRILETFDSHVDSIEPSNHVVPVCYELGEDLNDVAAALGLDPESVVAAHLGAEYRCYAVGFSPGFGYLGYLPELISGVSRLATPRVRVEPGSVGVTGRQTAVYPSATPGGWRLIGRTPLTLVDVEEDYFPLRAGDLVRFERIDESEFSRLKGERL